MHSGVLVAEILQYSQLIGISPAEYTAGITLLFCSNTITVSAKMVRCGLIAPAVRFVIATPASVPAWFDWQHNYYYTDYDLGKFDAETLPKDFKERKLVDFISVGQLRAYITADGLPGIVKAAQKRNYGPDGLTPALRALKQR